MKRLLTFIKFEKITLNRKVIIGLAVVALLLLVEIFVFVRHKQNKIHDLPSILESGRLAVLTDSSRLGFSVKGDSVFGFQYEIVKAFADTLGLELVVTEESNLKTCIEDLKGGDYDIIASFTPVTTEWKKDVLFTIPLFTSRQVLVQRIEGDSSHSKMIKSHFDLANETIFVPENSPYKMRLDHLSDEIANPIHVLEMKSKSTEQMVHLVALGKIKYTICDEQIAQQLKLQYPNIDISLPIGFEQEQAWAVHSGSHKLLEELNSFLNDFIGSSAYWKIYRKYY
jgi:membrane-bound lytic murein transglycosylase F